MAYYNELCHQCPTLLRHTMRKRRERGEALYNRALDYNFVIPMLVVLLNLAQSTCTHKFSLKPRFLLLELWLEVLPQLIIGTWLGECDVVIQPLYYSYINCTR